jgi:hypothetical protein
MAGATAVFLTHRQGTAIAMWSLEEFVAGTHAHQVGVGNPERTTQLVAQWLDDARLSGAAIPNQWFPSLDQCNLLAAAIHFLKVTSPDGRAESDLDMPQVTSGLGIWLSLQPTAETLWSHFRELSSLLGLTAADLDKIVFGGGPVGSFTGLRLGAAFAGGLAMGRGIDLLAVPTFAVPSVLPQTEEFSGKTPQAPPRFAKQAIQAIEVFAAMASVLAGGMLLAKAESLHYASEPGPVLTMQRVQNKIKP